MKTYFKENLYSNKIGIQVICFSCVVHYLFCNIIAHVIPQDILIIMSHVWDKNECDVIHANRLYVEIIQMKYIAICVFESLNILLCIYIYIACRKHLYVYNIIINGLKRSDGWPTCIITVSHYLYSLGFRFLLEKK